MTCTKKCVDVNVNAIKMDVKVCKLLACWSWHAPLGSCRQLTCRHTGWQATGGVGLEKGVSSRCVSDSRSPFPQVGFILAVAKFVYPTLPVAGVAPIPFRTNDVLLQGAWDEHPSRQRCGTAVMLGCGTLGCQRASVNAALYRQKPVGPSEAITCTSPLHRERPSRCVSAWPCRRGDAGGHRSVPVAPEPAAGGLAGARRLRVRRLRPPAGQHPPPLSCYSPLS